MKNFKVFCVWFMGLLSLLLISGCNLNTRMSTFTAKGPVAETQLNLFMLTVWVTGFIFLAVGGVYVYVVIRFRDKKDGNDSIPSQGHGNPLVELSLIGVSILLLVIIAVPTLQGIWYTHDVPDDESSLLGSWYTNGDLSEADAKEPFIIRAIGYRWWWEFEYPQLGITTANEMVMPAGRPIHIELRSVDVIHSFWLPKIAGKVDLIPGRSNSMWIQAGDTIDAWAKKVGFEGTESDRQVAYEQYLEDEIYDYYYGQCAEYCGDSHARMLFRAHVVKDEDFYAWVNRMNEGHTEAPEGMTWDDWYATYDETPEVLNSDIHEGLKLFMGRAKCATCHAVKGNPRAVGVAGPSLTYLAERHSIAAGWLNHRNEDNTVDSEAQLANFIKWIKHTDEVKPGNLMWKAKGAGIGELDPLLNDEEIRKISLYLQSLQ
jgi:cytochrome c oxidase subunit 2